MISRLAVLFLALAPLVMAQSEAIAQSDLNAVSPETEFELKRDPGQRGKELPSHVRKRYEKTADLPDEVAFRVVLETLNAKSKGSEDVRRRAAQKISAIMEMSMTDAYQFIDYVAEIRESFNRDYAEMMESMACPKDRPRAKGDEIFPIYEAIYDGRIALGTQYLAIMRSQLGEEKFTNFRRYLNYRKSSMTHTVYNYKAAYAASGRNVDQALGKMCAGFESNRRRKE